MLGEFQGGNRLLVPQSKKSRVPRQPRLIAKQQFFTSLFPVIMVPRATRTDSAVINGSNLPFSPMHSLPFGSHEVNHSPNTKLVVLRDSVARILGHLVQQHLPVGDTPLVGYTRNAIHAPKGLQEAQSADEK